jgi:SAM-dependent methyltransferase
MAPSDASKSNRAGEAPAASRAVEVRRAGGTRRLYVGEVLATQWHPKRTLAGGYWDALGTAALLSPAPCRTALVLGLGGGGVVHVLRRVARPRRIVGVETDRRVLAAARRAFPLRGDDLEVVVEDARRFLARSRERFDLVIDDVYEMAARRATRLGAEAAWFSALARRVAPRGVLAVNFVDAEAFDAARRGPLRRLSGFPAAFRFDFDAWQNVVVAAVRAPSSVARYEAAFAAAVPGREARRRGFALTAFRIPARPLRRA